MSQRPQKRKTIVEAAGVPIVVEGYPSDGYSDRGGANALIIQPSAQKRKNEDETEVGEAKKKKQQFGRERMLEKQKKKESKSKVKKLQKILERKRQKETREQLFECLQQYQLPTEQLNALVSTAHRNDKEKISRDEATQSALAVQFPSKLRSLSGAQIRAAEAKAAVQENYCETSESEGDMDDEEIQHIIDKYKGKPYRVEEPNSPITVAVKDEQSDSDEEEGKPRIPRNDEDDVSDLIGDVPSNLGGIKGEKVVVTRTAEIDAARSKLPLFAEEQSIVEAINENPVVIVSGETGSGKTTQIPQFLYEAGYTSKGHLIGVTEPRRVAAMSMASRVGTELNDSDAVSYQIRFEGNRTEKTKILFMTDGVLMKEMQNDIMLKSYSVIIIDEAHERSMYSDVLIGLLSRIAPMRAKTATPLKLIIMSATLRIDDFTQTRLFPTITPKIIKCESRQFPVTVHFEKKTPENYMAAAFKKVCKIHESLPAGAILIFVSGQLEVKRLMSQLKARYPWSSDRNAKNRRNKKATPEDKDMKLGDLEEAGVADAELFEDDHEIAQIDVDITSLGDPKPGSDALYCLPLYSLLSSKKQQRIFEEVPAGCRLCIVSTNVAETSLTIPNVRYVVDTGKEKRRLHDPITGVSMFKVMNISKASAEQRSGRAGRVSSGHAYRLYSSAVFEDFESFAMPEILNKPVDQLVLHMKSMNIVRVANFPFPTPPDPDQLEIAEKRLLKLDALKVGIAKNKSKEARITPLGKTLAHFPLSPKYAKMLAMSKQNALLPYAIAIVSMLSVREPLHPIHAIRGENEEETHKLMLEALKRRRKWSGTGQCRSLGDLAVLFKAIKSVGHIDASSCEKLGLRQKAIVEVRQMQKQLSQIIAMSLNTPDVDYAVLTSEPTEAQFKMLRQIAVASLSDQIARRVDPTEVDGEVPKGAYQCQNLQEYVFIDATSVLFKSEPDYVLYQDIVQVNDKMCMQNVTIVEAEWLPRLAENYCYFAPIDDKIDPTFDEATGTIVQSVRTTFGDREWLLGEIDRPLPNNIRVYRYFAQFFLEGRVFPVMAKNVSIMLATPSVVTKTWAKLQDRSEKLVNALIEYDVRSREQLETIWKERSEYLLAEYLAWLPQSVHDRIQLEWPPCDVAQ
ncbi:hypothetical protein QR680_011864 [Steinernema hermaphroditum]|uniref:RNA helicase n=1 Tax=Steinernema hermaphroditum TaxID=289476 RepID=A0AA39LYT1_9BILA|nr:hypothetical protein QR680_011864 [Steinernema hermaphroditum]